MRCLLIEDEQPRIDAILGRLQGYFGILQVDVAKDRDTALSYVSTRPYDLVVLDQRIPSAPSQLNADVEHGRAVLEYIREKAPHTIVYFLTALPMEDEYIDHIVANGEKVDVFGDRQPMSLVLRFNKANLEPFFKNVEALASTGRTTADIEINTKGAILHLDEDEIKIIRSFGRLQAGICVDIETITQGLSGARVIKADVKDQKGEIRMSAVGKIGGHGDISSEISRYEKEVIRLPSGTYAPLLPSPQARVLNRKGAFYRLLAGFDRTLFDLLKESSIEAADCVASLQSAESAWENHPEVQTAPISDHLKLLIWENRLPKIHSMLTNINWEAFERRSISVNMCTRHGDLHGENAKVDGGLRVMMLDYGAVGHLPSAIDAITLELSALFHPHGHRALLKWQPGDGPIDWFNVEGFAALTTAPEYVLACRRWAHNCAFGNREVLACAYIYILRQLQFPGADIDLALALLPGIINQQLTQ